MRKRVVSALRYLAVAAVAVTTAVVAVPSFGDPAATSCDPVARNGFSHFHASGLWSMGIKKDHQNNFDGDISVGEERKRLSKHADSYRDESSIVTHTETSQTGHWKAVRSKADSCWKSYHPKKAEEAVEWDGRRWSADKTGRKVLAKVSNRTITASTVRLTERTAPGGRDRQQVIVVVSHLPAAVEGDWDKNTSRVKKHKKAMSGIQKIVASNIKKSPNATVIVSGDWNLNHKAKYRYAINRHLEGKKYNIRPAWTKDNIGHSLYGSNRLIDADWYSNVKRCGAYVKDVKKKNAASDHIPYRARYSFTKKC